MAGDGEDKYVRYTNIPIPSYDEATSSRPTSSEELRGTQEINDEEERQGLLGQRHERYRSATVESVRNSLDDDEEDDLRLPEVNGEDAARRQVEELDYFDPSVPDTSRRNPRLYHRARLRGKWSQHLSSIGATLSSIRLPSFRSLYRPITTDTPIPPDTRTWLSRTSQRITIPERYRLSAPTAARLCGLFTLMALIYLLFVLDLFPGGRHHRRPFDPEAIRAFVQENINGDNIRNSLSHITSFDHVAGTEGDLYLAKWMQEKWEEEGGFDQLEMLPYYVYLDYPGERSVGIVRPESKRWTAALEEDQVYAQRQQTQAWHGHSKSGEAEGHLIYANGGSREDFAWLQENDVATNGSIALMKYGGTQGDRALKVKAAEEAGCVGVLIYSDPSDVEASAWQVSDDMLQRGGVSMMSYVVGDPLTPGFASTIDSTRVSKDGNPGLPSIPSLPLSWRDAKVLIQNLEGHGQRAPAIWVHGRRGESPSEWYTGAAPSVDAEAPVVHLKNVNDENPLQQIWNVHGMIEGVETPMKKIMVGNHRDAWCFGAVDPGSGSAVMMEVVRIFGELTKLDWRPLRTLEFVSWDAEEYNLVGSTEYVEDNIDFLRDNGVAYLNVDAGVSGSMFHAAGSPVWQRALMHVLDRVVDPGSNGTASLRQRWDQSSTQFDGLGAGSDYVAFQDMAGTSSIDFSFVAGLGADQEYYPYHSCHESFEWMTSYGDPDFSYHTALAQVWALLILEMADRPMLPFDVRVYAEKLNTYIGQLERDAAGTYAQLNHLAHASAGDLQRATNFTLQPLRDAVGALAANAETFHRFEDVWTANVLHPSGYGETAQFALKRLEWSNRLGRFETDLLDLEQNEGCPHGGVPGRCQYKHVVFGPQRWSGYDVGYFPFVRDAMEAGSWTEAQEWVQRASDRIHEASDRLLG